MNHSELKQYVPLDLLPKTLGGKQAAVHNTWLQLCKLVACGMQPDMTTYFMPPKVAPNRMSVSSAGYSSDDPHISDLDSESSKDTVHEKHNHEDREKEKGDGDKETDKKRKSSARRNSESRKRPSESQDVKEDDKSPSSDMPRKKRPLSSGSNILDDSIHMPESTGLTVEQLIDHVQTVKKKGLFNEYAHIRMEPHAGTFNYSKYVFSLCVLLWLLVMSIA